MKKVLLVLVIALAVSGIACQKKATESTTTAPAAVETPADNATMAPVDNVTPTDNATPAM